MKYRIVFLLLLILPNVSGCSQRLEKPTLEDLAMAGVIGFDMDSGEKVNVTVTIPQSGTDQTGDDKVLAATARMPHEVNYILSRTSSKTVSFRQVRVVLFGEDYARKTGLRRILINLYRDPLIGNNVYIAIVKGSAGALLSSPMPDKQKSVFLNNLLRPTEATAFSPFTTIRDFIFQMTNGIGDPIVPYIMKENNEIKLTGVALFKNDKMIDWISPKEANTLEMLRRNTNLPSISIPLDRDKSDSSMLIDYVKNKIKIHVSGTVGNPVIDINLKVSGAIQDYEGDLNLESVKDLDNLEKKSEAYIRQNLLKLLSENKQKGIDPIGLGKYARLKFRGTWSKEEWIKGFSNAQFNIHVKTRILNSGTLR